LVRAEIANRSAHSIDVAGEGGLGHDTAHPDRLKKVVLADHTVAVLHEIDKQIENLRPHCNTLGPASELPSAGVEHTVGKQEPHVTLHAFGHPDRQNDQPDQAATRRPTRCADTVRGPDCCAVG
jgi:hypothetical protein